MKYNSQYILKVYYEEKDNQIKSLGESLSALSLRQAGVEI